MRPGCTPFRQQLLLLHHRQHRCLPCLWLNHHPTPPPDTMVKVPEELVTIQMLLNRI
jgi:hypothetical protein